MRKPLNGWNRLFIVVAVCWAVIAPFLLMGNANEPVERSFALCANSASYISDTERYNSKISECIDASIRDFVSIQKVLGAMVGHGEIELGLLSWGLIIVPLALLWFVARIVFWIAAGFRRPKMG
jgi:hypothetical protein